ncbi:MAG: hypothetical protein HOC23_23960 [Halieaceae bacterium]|nr:hypothetical protein [Halieaceae bacterium]
MTYLLWLLLITFVSGPHGQERITPSPALKPNVVRWGTASEHANFGYNVYRGQSKDGPFAPINPQPITGAGTTDIPQRYEYRDQSIEANTVYWYYVESISLNGDRRRISPIYASKPKPATRGND